MTALRRHRRRRHAASVMASVLAAATLAAATDAAAGPEPALNDRSATLLVVHQDFGVSAGESLALTLQLTGIDSDLRAAVADPDAATGLRVLAHEPVATVDELTALDDQEGDPPVMARFDIEASDALSLDGEAATAEVAVPVDLSARPGTSPRLALDAFGIHPITVELVVDDDIRASTTTFFELVDPAAVDTPRFTVAIVAGLGDPGPWPSAPERASAAIEAAALIDLADDVDGPLSISLPPVVVRSLDDADAAPDGSAPAGSTLPVTSDATAGSDAAATASSDAAGPDVAGGPGTTEPLLTGITSAAAFGPAFRSDELLAAPATELDPSALDEIDQFGLFTDQLREGEDILATASPLATVSRAIWLSDRPVSASAATTLRNFGIRMLVLTDETAEALGVSAAAAIPPVFEVDLGAGGTLPAMTFGPLGRHLLLPSNGTATTPHDRAVRLLVELQLARRQSDTPAILLATPRVTVPDRAITARFVELAGGLADVSIVPMSRLPGIVDRSLVATTAAPVPLPARAGDDLTARWQRVEAARDRAVQAGSMLPDSDRRTRWLTEIDAAMSSAIDDATATQRLDATMSEVDAVMDAIEPPPGSTFTFTGTSNTLRLRIGNTSSEPLDVVVHVRSPKLRFPEPDPLITVPAMGSSLTEIPVEARSNGTFTIEVDILTPNRAPLADPVILKARVTRITGLSQVVTVAAVLVLASWWYSHLRRNRRQRLASAELGASSPSNSVVSPDAAEAQAPPRVDDGAQAFPRGSPTDRFPDRDQ